VSTARGTVEFHFDFISPFGYLASLRVDAMAAARGYETHWQSMLLGVSVLKVMGMKPLPQTPLKGGYLQRDLARYLRRHGLGLARLPGAPPADPLPAGRVFHLLDALHGQDAAKRAARALLEAYWQAGEDIGDPARAAAIAAGASGTAEAPLLEAARGGAGSAHLRAAVERSLARGVFGSPFFLVGEEPFFGLEKMELLDEWLATGGW